MKTKSAKKFTAQDVIEAHHTFSQAMNRLLKDMASEDETVFREAAATLKQIGEPAMPTVVNHICNQKDRARIMRFLDLIESMGKLAIKGLGLEIQERMQLGLDVKLVTQLVAMRMQLISQRCQRFERSSADAAPHGPGQEVKSCKS